MRRTLFYTLMFALGIGVALLVAASESHADEPPAVVHMYVTSDGIVSFTDDPEAVLEKYRDEAETVQVDGLVDYERGTTTNPIASERYALALEARLAHLRQVNAKPPVNPNRLNDCSGHVTVRKVRVQEGPYNRAKMVATDECGRVISVTGQYPEVRINR